jgi:hypothetical protein
MRLTSQWMYAQKKPAPGLAGRANVAGNVGTSKTHLLERVWWRQHHYRRRIALADDVVGYATSSTKGILLMCMV